MDDDHTDYDLDLTIWLLAPEVPTTYPGSLADAIAVALDELRSDNDNDNDSSDA